VLPGAGSGGQGFDPGIAQPAVQRGEIAQMVQQQAEQQRAEQQQRAGVPHKGPRQQRHAAER